MFSRAFRIRVREMGKCSVEDVYSGGWVVQVGETERSLSLEETKTHTRVRSYRSLVKDQLFSDQFFAVQFFALTEE